MKPFQLLVKPVSGDCNLACGYCFYRSVPQRLYGHTPTHRMSRDTLERVIRGFLGYGFSPAVISWQGGEPTLAGLEFFQEAVVLEEKYGHKGQVLGNAFQTNGLLIDDAWSRFLARYRFLVGLSLDGPPEIHDGNRTSAAGSGSWRQTMRTARRLARDGVEFNVLTVVSRANQERGRQVFQWLVSQGFSHIQFLPCVEREVRTGQATDLSVTPEGYARFLCEAFDQWLRVGPERVSVRDFESLLRFTVDGKNDLCTYQRACGSYLLVEHNGDVYPCDFFAEADWRLGNVADRPLAEFFELERMRQFTRTKHVQFDQCRGCRWWQTCYGGCLKDRMVAGTPEQNPTYLCRAYREFMQHAEPGFRALAEVVKRRRLEEQKAVRSGRKRP